MDRIDPTAALHAFPLSLEWPASNDPSLWAAAGVVGLLLLYVTVVRPLAKRRANRLTRQPAPHATSAQQRAVERDMAALLVEYEEMIRRMTAGVDIRAARLEALIREADEKLAALRAAVTAGGPVAAAAGSGADVTRVEGRLAAFDEPPSARSAAAADGPDPRHAEVYALADAGLCAREIGQRLGWHYGEVELILALRGGRVKPKPAGAAAAADDGAATLWPPPAVDAAGEATPQPGRGRRRRGKGSGASSA